MKSKDEEPKCKNKRFKVRVATTCILSNTFFFDNTRNQNRIASAIESFTTVRTNFRIYESIHKFFEHLFIYSFIRFPSLFYFPGHF